jgi:hypothetical protein
VKRERDDPLGSGDRDEFILTSGVVTGVLLFFNEWKNENQCDREVGRAHK